MKKRTHFERTYFMAILLFTFMIVIVANEGFTQFAKPRAFAAHKENQDLSEHKNTSTQPNNECHIPLQDNKPIAYLTFDDGPTLHTDPILDTLNKYGVGGTFFFIGERLHALRPSTIDKIKAGCFTVGSHSYTHDTKKIYEEELFIEENLDTFSLLEDLGFQTNLLRAPYGSTYVNQDDKEKAQQYGWQLLDWNIDSMDWKWKNAKKSYEHIIKQLDLFKKRQSEIVILLHEQSETTELLAMLIPEMKQRGFQLISGETKAFNNLTFKTS
ncbi:polysaccharide deacetylase family protein [Virgibacillus soli]|uniref:Polysaccharide deacetylase family protein n=1 Tax=Paracerasibacillus soli TaxID=480284 RepID=A0ABU5CT39_9BACI|nr:polysaccharide deacetylase family protein [Virgibacillus soli]MDY0409551.1 polysaccharide deacetylase family protein [Virgibacillus soli]